MNAPTETDLPRMGWLRDRSDWLLVLAGLCLLPWVLIYAADFWFRTDYRFFPVLIVAPLAITLWRGERSGELMGARWQFSLGLWVLGGLLAVLAGWLISAWVGMAALTVVWMAWSLARFRGTPWPRVIGWGLPLVALLVLPLSDATDRLHSFAGSVTQASSHVLDLLSIPQMPQEDALELRSGRLDVSALCRGLGNPYLLFALSVLLCLLTRPSLLLSLVTVASVPLWAWGATTGLIVVASVLSENFQIYLLIGYRLWIAQLLTLVAALLSVWLFQRGLRVFVSPFIAFSEGVGAWHKLFNSVVLFPDRDPLRKRKPSEVSGKDSSRLPAWRLRPTSITLSLLAVLLLSGGALAAYRLAAPGGAASAPRFLFEPQLSSVEIEKRIAPTALPVDLQGMKLVDFDIQATPGTATLGSQTARWTYAFEKNTLQLSLALPFRGFYPRERLWISDGSEVVEPRQSIESSSGLDHPGILVDEMVIKDPLVGPSYLLYATWIPDRTSAGSPNEPLARSAEITSEWTMANISAALRPQPNTASLSLFVAGFVPTNPDDRATYRRILMSAVERLR